MIKECSFAAVKLRFTRVNSKANEFLTCHVRNVARRHRAAKLKRLLLKSGMSGPICSRRIKTVCCVVLAAAAKQKLGKSKTAAMFFTLYFAATVV